MENCSLPLLFALLFYSFLTVININPDSRNIMRYFGCNGEPQTSHGQTTNLQKPIESTSTAKKASRIIFQRYQGGSPHKHAVRIALLSSYETTLCAGTIQNALHIITAAHCVHKLNASLLIVTAGKKLVRLEQNRSVISFDIHENFNPKTLQHDIALLKLNESLIFSVGHVHTVKIGQPQFQEGTASLAWITGWGLHNFDKNESLTYSEAAMQIDLSIVDHHTCKEVYQKIGKDVYEDQICAGGEVGYGPCTGDDGAPLTVGYQVGITSRLQVLGILSSYQGCAKGVPDIYTDLDKYKNWIQLKAGY